MFKLPPFSENVNGVVAASLEFTGNGHDEKRTEIFLKLRELDIKIEDLEACYKYLREDSDARIELVELLAKSKV